MAVSTCLREWERGAAGFAKQRPVKRQCALVGYVRSALQDPYEFSANLIEAPAVGLAFFLQYPGDFRTHF